MKEQHVDIQTHIGQSPDGKFAVKIIVNNMEPIYRGPFHTRSEAETYADKLPSLIGDKIMEMSEELHTTTKAGDEGK